MPETVGIRSLVCFSNRYTLVLFLLQLNLMRFVVLQDMNISGAAVHVVHFKSVIYELPFCLRCPYSYWQRESNLMSFIFFFNESWWFEATEYLSIMYLNADEQWSDAVTANSDQHFISLTTVLEGIFHSFSHLSWSGWNKVIVYLWLYISHYTYKTLNYSSVKNCTWHGRIEKQWHSMI